MRRLLLVGTAAAGATAGTWFAAVWVYHAPGPLPAAHDVVVPRGGMEHVSETLAHAGVIRGERLFRMAAIATAWQGPIHAAELNFPASASLEQVLSVLRFARPVQHRITIAEGLTSAQIAALLAREESLSGDVVLPREGSVLPETYVFERGTTRAAILERAESAMRARLAAAWAARAPGSPLTSMAQAVVLASIVERETALPAERPMVASVFLNRLRARMKLQADPTTAYGAAGGLGALGRALAHGDLERQDSYNTYAVAGLPATAICHPGIAAIEAVLHPAASDALYFVADGKGGHVFAERLDEHERNVARFRALPQ